LKIVHVDLGKTLRGGQEQLLLLARGLRDRGHEQWLACQNGTPLEGRARDQGIPVLSAPAFDPGKLGAIRRLRRTLRAERPDILHAHDARGQNLAWLASQGLPVRRVANRDVTFHPKIPGGRWLQSWKYTHMADLVVTCSGYIKQSLIRRGVPAARIEVIYGAIEWPEQLPSAYNPSRARAAWGFGEQEFVAGHVGAFAREKGQDIAIEAAALLKQRLPNIRIVLAGEISEEVLRDLRRRYPGLEGHVHLPGYVPDLEAFFAALDLFIMPSRGEGLGLSALQAMARGLAVVATSVGGLSEIVEDGHSGWLIPPGSPQALADAVFLASRDRAKLIEFGRNGRKRAEGFSAAIMVSRMETLYHRLTAGVHNV
jgi:glycosyltransferase involved in cell wall biosynthesis